MAIDANFIILKEEKMGTIYGYCRVSTREQHEDRQVIALKEMGVPEESIFMDKQSGKDFNRPQYKKLIRKLKPDDVIFIKSIDRLGRNYDEILEQWKIITKDKKADLYIIDMPLLDTRREKSLLGTLIADLVLTLFSYVAENERTTIKSRQAEGIAAARERGVRFGRPPKALPENFYEMYQKWKSRKITLEDAAVSCGMPKSTFFYRAKIFEKATISTV